MFKVITIIMNKNSYEIEKNFMKYVITIIREFRVFRNPARHFGIVRNPVRKIEDAGYNLYC